MKSLSRIILLCCVFSIISRAGEDWEKKRTQLMDQIKQKVAEQMKEKVSPAKIADFLGLPYPISEPLFTTEQIDAKAEVLAIEAADTEFSEQKKNDTIDEVRQKFHHFEIGDTVKVKINIKNEMIVEGRLLAVTPTRIQIGKKWIAPDDLEDDVKFRFYSEDCQKLIQRKEQVFMQKFENSKSLYQEEKKKEFFFQLLKENGYIPKEKDKNNANYELLSNWISAKSCLDEEVNRLWAKYEPEITKSITEKVMDEAGFVYSTEYEEWLPQSIIDQRKAEDAAAAEKQRQNAKKPKGFMSKLKNWFK